MTDAPGRSHATTTAPPRSDSGRSSLHTLLAAIGVFFAVVFLFLPTISADFIQLDDPQYVRDNAAVLKPSLRSAWRFVAEVRSPSTVAGYYQPLTMLSLMLDSWWYGANRPSPFPYHLTNVVLHALNSVLVFRLARRLAGGLFWPIVAALLFAAHPVQVESVAWISQRKTVLATLLGLLAVDLHLSASATGRAAHRGWAVAAYLLATLAKPTVVFLPVVMLLLDYWPLKRFGRAALLEKWPYALLVPLTAVVATISQRESAGLAIPDASRWEVMLALGRLTCYNVLLYSRNVVWPVDLSLTYALPQGVREGGGVLTLALIVVPAALIAIVLLRRRWPALFVVVAATLIALGPTLGPIRFMQSCIGDRFLYLPWSIIAVVMATVASARLRTIGPRRIAGMIAAVVVVAFASQSRARQAVWQADEPLWTDVVAKHPQCALGNYELAVVRHYQQRSAEALALLERSLEEEPDSAHRRPMYADILLDLGRIEDAHREIRRAIEMGLGPYEWRGRLTLGRVLAKRGDLRGAKAEFERIVAQGHDDPATLHVIGSALLQANDAVASLPYFQKAELAAPTEPIILQNHATACVLTGDLAGAAERYARAAELREAMGDPAADARLALAKVLLDLNRIDEAERWFNAVQSDPTVSADALLGLACVRALRGQTDDAFRLLECAIATDASLRRVAAAKRQLSVLRGDPRWASIVNGPATTSEAPR
ncbi:MAG: tetratricopeptide repeat protein [Phycisphaerae bacterium]|nr:tetratricopeptide repeat protein [Phycisphaerae bacterium]